MGGPQAGARPCRGVRHLCIHVVVDTFVCVCLRACVFVHRIVYAHVYVCTHMCMCVCTCVCVCVCESVCVCMCVCVCVSVQQRAEKFNICNFWNLFVFLLRCISVASRLHLPVCLHVDGWGWVGVGGGWRRRGSGPSPASTFFSSLFILFWEVFLPPHACYDPMPLHYKGATHLTAGCHVVNGNKQTKRWWDWINGMDSCSHGLKLDVVKTTFALRICLHSLHRNRQRAANCNF